MKKVVIVGAGFAGLSVLSRINRLRKDFNLILIDKRDKSNFLPLLPDIIGRKIKPDFLEFDLEYLSRKKGVKFIKDEVVSVNLDKNVVYTAGDSFTYDYIILANGSETNFYGNKDIKQSSYTLDSVESLIKMRAALEKDDFDSFIISGGGYTGIEITTNLKRFFNTRKKNKKIIIVEKGKNILGQLPEWMRDYTLENLKNLDIEVLTHSMVEKVEENSIHLSGGRVYSKAMLVWTAGVKTTDFIYNLPLEKDKQGRLKVDESLRIKSNCFAAGDVASFSHRRERPLRMAVQFSIAQGHLAGENTVRSVFGIPLKKYRPRDLGFIVPMANNKSCGRVMGFNTRGKLATFLHYLMCIYRSHALGNKAGIFADLINSK
ncbi:MAG: hypothetical protein GF375_01750 [Candidatus Omnitrophica bacterium]|nr:hypothetical protein [Candidatus Omnitrophota bacterium]MBD3268848.1 hypothetical protein [Candidatus Omnitrophota bacterium]